jgi:hypothetical protein
MLVFLVHFAWAGLFGMLTLIALRFLPTNLNGFVFSTGSLLIFVALLVFLMTGGNWKLPSMLLQPSVPTAVPMLPTLALNLPATSTEGSFVQTSPTPLIETSTPVPLTPATLATLAVTLPQADTPTFTLTIQPTPVYARIDATQANGANLRVSPNGKFIIELDNGTIVEVQPDTQDVNGVIWAHVIAIRNNQRYDGWILQSVLAIATPVPLWNPSSTPVDTETPTITSTP